MHASAGRASAGPGETPSGQRRKRWFDVGLAAVGLVLSAPLWPLVAAAVKLEDGGPVFFRQRRWGWRGERFTALKFRTMNHDADASGGSRPATVADPRVTRTGRVLRATGLDELPQLLHILRGQMSFVGPRALAVDERVPDADGVLRRYEEIPGFAERLQVRPGLTGHTTVHRPKDMPVREKFAADVAYVRSRTFAGDVVLVALSLWISLRGRWEHRGRKL